jgi:hypothetical protein
VIIYHFNNVTGELIGDSLATLDPIDKAPLVPNGATPVEVPPTGEKEVAVWSSVSGAWEVIADHRGEEWYDQTRTLHIISEIGQTPHSSWVKEEPPLSEEELVEIHKAQTKQTKKELFEALVVTTTKGNTFDGNETARNNMLSAIQASTFTGTTTTNWRMADNALVSVTLDELKEALTLAIQAVGVIVTEAV